MAGRGTAVDAAALSPTMTDIDPRADIEIHPAAAGVTVRMPLAGPVPGGWLQCYQQLALARGMSVQGQAHDDRAWVVVNVAASSDPAEVAAMLDDARAGSSVPARVAEHDNRPGADGDLITSGCRLGRTAGYRRVVGVDLGAPGGLLLGGREGERKRFPPRIHQDKAVVIEQQRAVCGPVRRVRPVQVERGSQGTRVRPVAGGHR